jgi:single-strand DNA-binding protein
MSANVNEVRIIGRLTRDPVLSYTATGVAVARFGIATNRYVGAGKPEEVFFGEVVCFYKTAENVGRYLCKGSPAYISGYLKNERWTADNGVAKSATRIVAETVQFLSSSSQSPHGSPPSQSPHGSPAAEKPAETTAAQPASEGGLPF